MEDSRGRDRADTGRTREKGAVQEEKGWRELKMERKMTGRRGQDGINDGDENDE